MAPLWFLVILVCIPDRSYAACINETCATYCKEDSCVECKDAYYWSSNVRECTQCSYTCKNCTTGETCFSCVSTECDLCPNNCTNDTCPNEPCTECLDGFYLHSEQCFRCFWTGCTCEELSVCKECLPGFYGPMCESPCPTDCKDDFCDKDYGNCTQGCHPGKYGSSCEHNCSTLCTDNACDVTNGSCTDGCVEGYFLSSNFTCQKCSENCTSCTSLTQCTECKGHFYLGTGKCVACHHRCNSCSDFYHCNVCAKSYYWGQACAYDCTGCHNYCNQTNGCSVQCEAAYYQTYNYGKMGFECTRCPGNCLSCTNGSLCNECTPGRWGSICQNTCDDCIAEKCHKDTGCVFNCTDGYSHVITETESYCILCPENCETCSSNLTCRRCKEGFYSANDRTCLKCSENCKNGAACDRLTGICSSGCRNGWRGEKCDNKCPITCVECEQSASSLCSTCHRGYYGNKCEFNCSVYCAVSDKEQLCEKETGSCINGCQTAFWGKVCTKRCSAGCKRLICNTTNGKCLNGCADNFYGITCNNTCSEKCKLLESSSSERTCDADNGSCLYSCKVGWYGTFCNQTCTGHCNGSICNKLDGKCEFGCAKGYTNENCDQEQGSGTISPKEDGNSAIVIGAAAGAVVALVIFVAGIIIVFILRRRRGAGQEDSSEHSLCLEATTLETADEPTYSRIEKKHAVDSTDSVITAGSIALKDTAPDNNTDTLTNQACPEALTYAKEDSRFRKQSHEEEACQVSREEELLEETGFAGKSDPNTYYNATGRRISLQKLADYVERKAVQDIENEFQKLPNGLSTEKEYTVARQRNNILKNRYKFIYPYDESRVVLKDGGNDFINASYIEGFNRSREYIGAMGPFEKGDVDIVPDFWRMIWQEQCETIVMLTNLVENRQTKCKQYWPDQGTSETYGDLNVACMTEDVYADFIVRSFTVTNDGETLRVRHLHFTAWPDKTVPDDVTCLIEFRQKVRILHKEKTCPIIVHCSAGIGRTGTFIALDILTFEGEARGYIDIFGCVATIRSQRVNLVQTPEQYVYLHHSVVHSLTFNCQAIQGDMFIEHYRKLNEKTDGSTAIAKQYEKLQSSFPEQSLEERSLIQNKTLANKIRKEADLAVDGYRVILRENRKPGASDFINAAFVNGFRTRRKFIAAQTPLPATVVDFLSMVIQEKCSCIVMMNEASLQDKSVGVYWPADNQVIKHGVFQVSCVESESFPNYTVKKLVLTCHTQDNESTQDVHLFMFTAWPIESLTPKTPESLLELIKAVDVHARGSANKGPVIVHCMTGSQRSCLYCAVSVLIEKMEIEHEVSVVNTLRQIKSRRHSAVPTLEQYKFCHQALVCYLQSFDIYSNFGLRSSQAVAL